MEPAELEQLSMENKLEVSLAFNDHRTNCFHPCSRLKESQGPI